MIWELITGLGLGEQLVAAAGMFAVAWYLLRGLSLAGTIGVAITSGVMYVVVTAVVIGIVLALGWLDPEPGVIRDTIASVRGIVEDIILERVARFLGGGV